MDFRFRPDNSWTFGGLIAAFLHLSLAYFLLCVSVYVFFTSKFLSLFGLYLPCPCNGVFGYKNSNLCWQTLLFHWPTTIIYSVLNSALSKLPFDFKNQGCSLDRKLVIKGSCENGVLELEGEASCSSSFHSPLLQNCVAKGKRRSVVAANFPYDGSEMRGKESESLGCEPVREDDFPGEIIGPISIEVGERNQHSFELSGSCDEGTSSSVATYITNAPDNMEIVRNEAYNIRMLELALEEEKAAHAALILELEKERAAAASAADEAMSKISRLHQDKASVEMELRQYQRMIEEKCDYDEEEMNILKEILVRREIENHFLEKKIEEYRQMSLLENEMPTGDINDKMDNWGQRPSSSLDLTDNKQPMLQIENNMLIGKKMGNRAKWSSNYEAPLVEKQSQIQGYSLLEKNVFFTGKENENMDNSIECQEMTSEATQICNGIDTNFSFDGEELKKYRNDKDQAGSNHHCSMPDTELVVYDVHVVDDKNETSKDQSGSSIRNVVDEPKDCAVPLGASGDWMRETLSDHPIISRTVAEPNIHKGSFDMSDKFSVLTHSQCKSLLSDEKLKLDIGIERLTERLQVLQEEKEELTIYLEKGDGEKDN
nr:myosin-binding protein 2 [Quercus suber]